MKFVSLACFSLLASGVLGSRNDKASTPQCKTVPGDAKWPSESTWESLNDQVGGRLIKTSPIAETCYPGSGQDLADCDYISREWPVEDFQTSQAIGRVLPYNVTCPPVDYKAGERPTASCILGINPVYAVNATCQADIKATLEFAQKHNVRLVTTGTGHDLLGRSDGYGSLQVWLRYYRNKITYQEKYAASNGCNSSTWEGGAMHVDGVYQWRDVAKVARKNNVWVATGGTPSVGAIGGWSQGGGHGPATNAVGWGVDQILEAEVLLADGRIVTANACENSDLYRSLRGGGPGYGIVLSMFVKAHANVNNITAHRLTIVPGALDTNKSEMIDAITDLVQQVPGLVDGGLGGYASWWKDFPTAVIGNSTSGYSHGIYAIGQNETATRATIESVVESLRQKHNSSLQINSTYVTYSDYWTFYYGEMGLDAPESNTTIMTSRAINRDHVSNTTAVRDLVDTLTDAPGQYNSQVLIFVGGRQVAQQGTDPFAGYHPAWRKASFGWVNVRVVPLSATQAERHATDEDMLSRTALMERFAPGTGAYMNEADRQDPNYIQNFYGDNYGSHLATKNKYDPNNVFYCATCVGSESFIEKPDGPLCMI